MDRGLRGQAPITATGTAAPRTQFDHRAHARSLPPPPVGQRERLELPQVADGVLGDDARAGEGPVEGHVLRGALFPARLAARRDHVVYGPVGLVAHERVVQCHPRQHPRLESTKKSGVPHHLRYRR